MQEWTIRVTPPSNPTLCAEPAPSHFLVEAKSAAEAKATAAGLHWRGQSLVVPGSRIEAFPRFM